MSALAVERPCWGPVDLTRYRGRWRAHRDDERYLAQYAQELRAEAVTRGHRTETAMFFGEGEHRGRGERRLRAADWRREARLAAEYAREQPAPHGSAGAYRTCAQPDGRRCQACRSYQADRVAANRVARLARELCTSTRSSYDAGCRCAGCVAANSAGCARWRRRSMP